jgi:predicted RNA binding protein YcfA (HicA-like mRNA interferase family)
MKYSKNVWQQLKSITADELIRALEKDGWVRDVGVGAELVYRHEDGRIVSIHYHPRKTYRPGLLEALLGDIGWAEADMRRLKLIK